VTLPQAVPFAAQWLDAWNRQDVEAVLRHYAEDVVFTSPLASRFVPSSGGVVRGKDALRQYWTVALQNNPELRFRLTGVYAGIDTIVLNYRNQHGRSLCEVMTFRQGLVAVGHATSLETSDEAPR